MLALSRLLKAAAILAAAFSLLTLCNQWHPLLELFAHFRLQYLVTAVLLALALLALRERAWAGAMLALALVNAWPVAGWYHADAVPASDAAHSFTVLQANVYGGNHNTAALLELIEREQPDIIFLQEVTDVWVAAMAPLAEHYPHHFAIPRDDNFGIGVYARDALLDVETIESPPAGLPTLKVRQAVEGRTLTFVTSHPYPPMGGKWTRARNEQLAGLAELMASIPGPKALIGDLNTTMWAHHYRPLVERTGLRNARKGFGVIPTWPRQLPFAAIPIDHCLVSEELAVLDMYAGPGIGSDHRPLIIKLALLERL